MKRNIYGAIFLLVFVVGLSGLISSQFILNNNISKQINPNNKVIVFVHGIRPPTDCASRDVKADIGAETFGEIKKELITKTGIEENRFFYYNYSFTPSNLFLEDCRDTWASLATHTEKLNSFISTIVLKNYPDADITFISHSLGGLLVANWLTATKSDYLKHLNSLITIDSPLRGASLAGICDNLAVSFLAPVCNDLKLGSSTIRQVEQLAPSITKIYNIRNMADAIVKPEEAYLDGAAGILDLNVSSYGNFTEHNVGLAHPEALKFIVSIVNDARKFPSFIFGRESALG
ncbi:MAG: hypothetical protein HXX08_15550 [Chloroflexi bacterium]|uniref:GPI inositol-deacylase PGAP1-like alpha/beta domain-containing protein n=1 Tax=Candidatus Chlorohelix allophototropha TaxID=3003348 RepID=A0A8T7M580_9CHLR|nr:hypothetical protein [Chloroflexota bacterium]WJW69195.1 hypothetical protein OZ401_002791 [Chloroflexota bacterium L227-S17]